MTGLILAADYPERVSNLVIVNGAARTLRAPDYPMGFEDRRGRPLRDGGDGARCRRPGLRHAGFHRAQRGQRRRIPRVVGHGRKPGRLTQHGPRDHPDRQRTPMSATPWRASPRRRWSCIAKIRDSPRSTTAGIFAEHIAGAQLRRAARSRRPVLGGRHRSDARRDRGVRHRRAGRVRRRACAHHHHVHRHRRLDRARRSCSATAGGGTCWTTTTPWCVTNSNGSAVSK